MDKTYAETQGHAPFDWNKWLDAAITDPSSITDQEHARVRSLAVKWVTCACGNQCAIIPRNETYHTPESGAGAPLDNQLRRYGENFYLSIAWKMWGSAKNELAIIEGRSEVLIAEELAKLNPA